MQTDRMSHTSDINQRLCFYDDMTATPVPEFTREIMSRNNCKKCHNYCSYLKRKNYSKFFESLHLLTVIWLLICPVSGGPLIQTGKHTRSKAISLSLRHLHRDIQKVDIDSVPLIVSYTVLSQGLPFGSLAYYKSLSSQREAPQQSGLSSQDLENTSESAIAGSSPELQQEILTGDQDSTSATSPQVPNKLSSSPLLKVFEPPHTSPSKVVDSVNSGEALDNRSSSMDEADESSAAGRERRASGGTRTGRAEWMRPCPNLESEPDVNATPASLSTLIVRAIQEASSQVDRFKNNFAMERLDANSWEEALPELEGKPLSFLNNTSGMDLKNPEGVSFSEALLEAYEMMQRRAVGIEQVTLDQALYQSSFLTDFRHVEDRIVHVLCELSHAMNQLGVDRKQISKDVMSEEIRDIDSERGRNIRDAVILKEYIEALQVLHALFNHFESSTQ